MSRRRAYAPLDVYLNNRLVGRLLKGAAGAISFAYDPGGWLCPPQSRFHCPCPCARHCLPAVRCWRFLRTFCRTPTQSVVVSLKKSVRRAPMRLAYSLSLAAIALAPCNSCPRDKSQHRPASSRRKP